MLHYFKIIPDIIFKPLRAIHLPLHLQMETTTICNLNCITCPRTIRTVKPKDMNFQSFKMIYDQIKPKRLNLSGLGEPLACKDIFKISSYASQNGCLVNFPTNFTLAGNCLKEILRSRISQIKISIDAANPDTYFKIRGVDKFEEIIESIQILNDLKLKAGVTKPEIRFNFALMKKNILELVEIINLAHRLKVGVIYFQDLVFTGIEDKKTKIVGDLNFINLRKILTAAEIVAKERKIRTNLSIWLKNLELYTNKMEPIENFQPNMRICYFPWFSTYIDVYGNVRPCPHFLFKADEGIMGNVFNDKFEDIWNNYNYKLLRLEFKNRQRPFTVCKTCIPKNVSDLIQISSRFLPKSQSVV